ncbi:M28 family peptidase [Fulvivirga sedimenti]|uniref:M28 family peptidase n=1 Tax=Fulvivirga sedimenti TaxID=2879465 RepID=A0A9X1HVH0_9BACT|nr:M28 family peptidase [Fulvivirga sedimenti]MCA6079018.1 M28 family peptidase [Fulvivirga sedimenti]
MNKHIFFVPALVLSFTFAGCNNNNASKEVSVSEEASTVALDIPDFNADSAYHYVETQVNFGPRVPNTESHRQAATYFVAKLKSYGAKVTEQDFVATTFDEKQVNLKNIIASFRPENKRRILLAAHWDTRPFADKDSERQDEPIDGANDGASGVGVLLEIARIISAQDPGVGVDIILFDGEDWGNDTGTQRSVPLPEGLDSWWCLGSQYWAKNPHQPNYSAYFGILLDMVGGENATFYREGYSMEVAPLIVDKVWKTAAKLGYSNHFIPRNSGPITDDHVFVNLYRNIPMIDIIPTDVNDNSFGDFHHTHKDNMEIISRETLDAVGETVLHVLFESAT